MPTEFLTKIILSIIIVIGLFIFLGIDNGFMFFVIIILTFLIAYFLLIIYKLNTGIPINNNKSKKIPKKIYVTYYSKKKIPKKVWKNLYYFGKGYKINFFSDNDCINYLNKNFNHKFSNKFKQIKLGAHKADFFRYCILYKEGGIYLDIDLEPKIKFDKIFDHESEKIFYTIIAETKLSKRKKKLFKIREIFRRLNNQSEKSIFQAMIATYPNNPIFKKLIKDFWVITNLHKKHDIITIKFYYRLKDIVSQNLKEGIFLTRNKDKIILFSEHNKKIKKNEKPDRTGNYPKVFNKNKVLFNSRYFDYPW